MSSRRLWRGRRRAESGLGAAEFGVVFGKCGLDSAKMWLGSTTCRPASANPGAFWAELGLVPPKLVVDSTKVGAVLTIFGD